MQNTTQKLKQSFSFWETRYFVWKFKHFDELQLSYSLTFFAEKNPTHPFVDITK